MLLCGVSCVQTSNIHYSYCMCVCIFVFRPYTRLSFEWIALDWVRHLVARYVRPNTYVYRNNATVKRVFHSAYEIIRCDVAPNTKVCASTRPSTVIIERQIRPDWALACYASIGMCLRCRRFSLCVLFLFDRIPIPWANDRHEMHLPCIRFSSLCLLSLEFRSLSVIFRMELFFLFFFVHIYSFVHFLSIAWLDQDVVVRCRCYEIHSTNGPVCKRKKEIYITATVPTYTLNGFWKSLFVLSTKTTETVNVRRHGDASQFVLWTRFSFMAMCL